MATEDLGNLEWERSKISQQDVKLLKKLGISGKQDALRFPKEESYPAPPMQYRPNWSLWKRIFFCRRNGSSSVAYNIGGVVICVRPDVEYFDVKFPDSVQGWRKKWLYIREENHGSVEDNIPPFDGAEKICRRRSWDAEATDAEKAATEALMTRIHELQNTRGQELSDVDRLSVDLSVNDLAKLVRKISSLNKKDSVPTSCGVTPYSATNALPQNHATASPLPPLPEGGEVEERAVVTDDNQGTSRPESEAAGSRKSAASSEKDAEAEATSSTRSPPSAASPRSKRKRDEAVDTGTSKAGAARAEETVPDAKKEALDLYEAALISSGDEEEDAPLTRLLERARLPFMKELIRFGTQFIGYREYAAKLEEKLAEANKRADALAAELEQSETARMKAEADAATVEDLQKRLDDAKNALSENVAQHSAREEEILSRLESQSRRFVRRTHQEYELENPEGDQLLDALSLLEIHGTEARDGLAEAEIGLSRLFPYFFKKKEEPAIFIDLAKCFTSQEDLGLQLRQEGLKVGVEGSFLDATIAKSRQIENTETPNENAATPVNSPESVEYSSDDLDEDYVELDDDFIEKCNATTDARKIKKLLAEHEKNDAEELLAKISRNHDDWSTPEPTPTPIVKKRGMIKLNDEDMREAKKSLKEKGIKPEDVKNLPPIEDLYNDKDDTPDKEEVEKEPEKHAKNKKYTKEDFIAEKHGAVIDCNKGMVTFNVDDKEHTVYFPKRIDKVYGVNTISNVKTIKVGSIDCPIYEPKEEYQTLVIGSISIQYKKRKMKKFKFGELFKKGTTSTGRPSRASTQIRRSYNEDIIAPSFAPEEDNGAPNASSFPCYDFLTNAGILDDFFTLVNRAGLATYVGDEREQYYMLTKIFVESFKFHNTQYEPTVAFKIYDNPVTMELEEFCRALDIAPVGTARRIDDNPRDLLELYRGITEDDCRTIQRGKIRNIQLPAIKYFAYYIATSILGRENTSNISSYHLAFLNAALTGQTLYHLGSLIARRLSSRGPIFGGTIALRILTHLRLPLDSNDVPLTPRRLDIAAMKSHHFVTTDSTIDNMVYRMLFADGNEKEIPLPQPGLFNIDRQSWSLTKEEVEEHMKIQDFHQQHDSEDAEPSYDCTVTYPDVSSSTYLEPGRSSSYYGDTTSWGPWE
ncbi:hypothetical protein QYE76_021489 [Lolium multiflorum]|uniref:Arabidopsis retrotransposon Orf1 C-terminal domain-containing protein n=2 Tax=Lolium multiflorum TaxID=4521 RepID=A0AAD8R939_LOLMU|nr:hypothetical protein QYE76_021489 [Lolium multiflorum]